MSEPDSETRARVLAAAARLFAKSGFKKVTVREICSDAEANVAAVNYHFGDKLGLYHEVLGKAIKTMKGTTEAAMSMGEGESPEGKLRVYIRVFLQRVIAQGGDSWIHQLMQREMADPTPSLDLVIDEVIRPRMAYLGEILGEILHLPADDARVLRSVMSVQAQCHALMVNPVSRRLAPGLLADAASIEAHAAHIADFSLGGLRSLDHTETSPVAQR